MSDLLSRKALHDSIGQEELLSCLSDEDIHECGLHVDEDGELWFTEEQMRAMSALYIAMRKFVSEFPSTHPFEALGRGCYCWECQNSVMGLMGQICSKTMADTIVSDCHFCSYGRR